MNSPLQLQISGAPVRVAQHAVVCPMLPLHDPHTRLVTSWRVWSIAQIAADKFSAIIYFRVSVFGIWSELISVTLDRLL